MHVRSSLQILLVLVAVFSCPLIAMGADKADPPASNGQTASDSKDAAKPQSLFDGKELGHWKSTDFGGQGEVKVEDGKMILTHGESLTGVTWQGDVPARMNYEIELDAQRVDGSDFFCGLTFPVNKSCASLIVGGWGGGVCGISCLDDNDAARNETTKVLEFKTGKWYHIRLRIIPDKIQAWIDDDKIVDVETKDRKISVRFEVEPSQPLGIASYQTTAALKNIRLRKLVSK